MFLFVVAILFGLIGLALLALARFFGKGEDENGKKFNDKAGARVIGVVLVVLAFLLFVVSGLKSVPTKNIGIPIAFGKITGQPFTAGIHETWEPWLHLADVSKRVQTTTFEVNQRTGQGGLDVRIGGQQTAQLDLTIQWQVQDSAADNLFLDYGANGDDIMADIRNAVVVRSLKSAANAVMGDYNPIQDVSLNSTAGNSQFTKFAGLIKAAMIHDIGGRIHVLSVLLPLAHYDASTQARLNAIQQQYAETAIAKQQLKTNQAQAAANDALRNSVGNDPNVLIANCEQIVKEAIKANYQGLPATFCSVGGTGTGVVVPAHK
jgi:regulator of protease activity HflC (stomatin/prohibitin superfamily)